MHIISNYYSYDRIKNTFIKKYNFFKYFNGEINLRQKGKIILQQILLNDNHIQFKYLFLNKFYDNDSYDNLYMRYILSYKSTKCTNVYKYYWGNRIIELTIKTIYILKIDWDYTLINFIIRYYNFYDFIYYFNILEQHKCKGLYILYLFALKNNKLRIAKFLYSKKIYSKRKDVYKYINTLSTLKYIYDKDSIKNINLEYALKKYNIKMLYYILDNHNFTIEYKHIKLAVKYSSHKLFIKYNDFKKELQNSFVLSNAIWWSIYNNNIESFEYFNNLHFKFNQSDANINLLKHLVFSSCYEGNKMLHYLKEINYKYIMENGCFSHRIFYYLSVKDILRMIENKIFDVFHHFNYYPFRVVKIINVACKYNYIDIFDMFFHLLPSRFIVKNRLGIHDKNKYYYYSKLIVKNKNIILLEHFIEKYIDKLKDNKDIKNYIIYLLKTKI